SAMPGRFWLTGFCPAGFAFGNNPPVSVGSDFQNALIHEFNAQSANETAFEPVVERFDSEYMPALMQHPGQIVFVQRAPIAASTNLSSVEEQPIAIVHG